MTAVVIQARLDSSRLPGKALLPLGGKPVILRVMENLRHVPADAYVLACDDASFEKLAPVAERAGFICLHGPKEDVLERFCRVVKQVRADVVIRVTGDNPFIFADAAEASAVRFAEIKKEGDGKKSAPDYFTYTGLPHGSGVEVFSAAALVRAGEMPRSAYEREHVGPALYFHQDEFRCVFEKAPAQWSDSALRTTIDTADDYAAARAVADFFLSEKKPFPVFSQDIRKAFDFVLRPVVFVPSVRAQTGTGHLLRTFRAVLHLRDAWNCWIYISEAEKNECADKKISKVLSLFETDEAAFLTERIVNRIPHEKIFPRVHRFVLDCFQTEKKEMLSFINGAPVIAVDEGGASRNLADYVFDVIPSLRTAPAKKKSASAAPCVRDANLFLPSCVPLPSVSRKPSADSGGDSVRTVLVVAGGADESGVALPYGKLFAACGFKTTAVCPSAFSGGENTNIEKKYAEGTESGENSCLTVLQRIPSLSENLHAFDLVVTHFGFTAFEALAAGCRVALFSPTRYHKKLALAYGFPVLPGARFQSESPARARTAKKLRRFVAALDAVPPVRDACAEFLPGNSGSENARAHSGAQTEYGGALASVLAGDALPCVFCGADNNAADARKKKMFRFREKTVAFCRTCGMAYIRYSVSGGKTYSREYFFDEYKKQYGKDYLEDFDAIRRMGMRRMRVIDKITARSFPAKDGQKTVLDVGCAYGPFLSAAAETGWQPFGTDISEDAVGYVRQTLRFPAAVSAFPNFTPAVAGKEFPAAFHAVSFWYVIEHFKNLPAVFEKVSEILLPGGILAVSTPSASGISARKNARAFFEASPSDHFSVWNPRRIKRQLRRFGFRVVKIVVTGHHPERFPCKYIPKFLRGFYFSVCRAASRVFWLGDTFECYAVKENGGRKKHE